MDSGFYHSETRPRFLLFRFRMKLSNVSKLVSTLSLLAVGLVVAGYAFALQNGFAATDVGQLMEYQQEMVRIGRKLADAGRATSGHAVPSERLAEELRGATRALQTLRERVLSLKATSDASSDAQAQLHKAVFAMETYLLLLESTLHPETPTQRAYIERQLASTEPTMLETIAMAKASLTRLVTH